MLAALRFAAHNVVHFRWNKGMTKSYLRICAIPDRVTNTMYDHLNNMEDPEERTEATEQSNEYVPFVWLSIVSTSAWIDAGMYHIFHGIVTGVMLAMEDVFTKEDKKQLLRT